MNGFNAAKIDILTALEDLGESTADEITSYLDRGHESTSMALLSITVKD